MFHHEVGARIHLKLLLKKINWNLVELVGVNMLKTVITIIRQVLNIKMKITA